MARKQKSLKVFDIKAKARSAVASAIRVGRLIRPDKCEACGNLGPAASDGRATIHGHHYKGYDFPLEVQWLCAKCHCIEDPRPSGEASPRAVVPDEVIEEIRRRYIPAPRYDGKNVWPHSMEALALEFGISTGYVGHLIKGQYRTVKKETQS